MNQFWQDVALHCAWWDLSSHGIWTLQDDLCGKAGKAQEFVLKLSESAPFPIGVTEGWRTTVLGETLYEKELPYNIGMVSCFIF